MNKADYSVTAGIMELPDGHCFEVGSHEWWEWVSSDKAESFRFECDHGVKGYRARKESIKSLERENCYQQLLEQKIRLEKQVKELKDELHNTLGNQQSLKLDGIKIYKLHGQEVVRVEDLRRIHSSISSP
jgi:hypothetical protein